jgi:hypothetical protein
LFTKQGDGANDALGRIEMPTMQVKDCDAPLGLVLGALFVSELIRTYLKIADCCRSDNNVE